jgi:hypothetical protein
MWSITALINIDQLKTAYVKDDCCGTFQKGEERGTDIAHTNLFHFKISQTWLKEETTSSSRITQFPLAQFPLTQILVYERASGGTLHYLNTVTPMRISITKYTKIHTMRGIGVFRLFQKVSYESWNISLT